MAIKKIIGLDVPLSYPEFSKIIIMHTDARKFMIGRVTRNMVFPLPFTHAIKPHLNKLYYYSLKNV